MKKLVLSLALIGFGTFAMAQQNSAPMRDSKDHKEMMEKRKADHLAKMQKELNLTSSQVAQLKAMQEKHQAEREQQRMANQAQRQQKMDALKKDKQQMDNEMRKILTPEQYTKWHAKKQEMMNNRNKKMDKKWQGKMQKGMPKQQIQ